MSDTSEPVVGKEYLCFRDGAYIGRATYTLDRNIGHAFIQMIVDINGKLLHAVFDPDNFIEVKDE